jgi:hypothetical protein
MWKTLCAIATLTLISQSTFAYDADHVRKAIRTGAGTVDRPVFCTKDDDATPASAGDACLFGYVLKKANVVRSPVSRKATDSSDYLEVYWGWKTPNGTVFTHDLTRHRIDSVELNCKSGGKHCHRGQDWSDAEGQNARHDEDPKVHYLDPNF